MSAVQILAKGPLSSALGQWLFVGCGAFYIFTGQNGVGSAARELAAVALRLTTGEGGRLLQEARLGSSATALQHSGGRQQPPPPIIIHTGGNDSNSQGWTACLVRLSVGAGACWLSYVLLTKCLPDRLKELLPVTRQHFEVAVTSLGQGVLRVREVLGAQIAALGFKQDAMAQRQEETHEEVRGVRDDVGDVQRHVDDIACAISRCESALYDAEGKQTYTSQGVGLLVRCVGDLLRANDPAVAEELDRFERSAKMLDDGGHHGHHKRRHVECDLSEIGSTASTTADEHRSPGRDRFVTPAPSSAKKDLAGASPLPGISPPPRTLHMLRSFHGQGGRKDGGRNGSGSATTATTSSSSSSDASPEDEVPRSNKTASDIDELLRIVRNGGTPSMLA